MRCVAASVLVLAVNIASTVAVHAQTPTRFPVSSVRFEQNATDGDVEVVFTITGPKTGLASLRVLSPDGRTIVDFQAPDHSTLGMRQFVFESPEPRDVAGLKVAYPEGNYAFEGKSISGELLRGNAMLTHKLPKTTAFVSPRANSKNIAIEDLQISWAPVDGLAGYIVEIEQDELDVNLTARLPATANSFVVPAGFLRRGTEYQLAIGTVSNDGTISYVETHFTTAAD